MQKVPTVRVHEPQADPVEDTAERDIERAHERGTAVELGLALVEDDMELLERRAPEGNPASRSELQIDERDDRYRHLDAQLHRGQDRSEAKLGLGVPIGSGPRRGVVYLQGTPDGRTFGPQVIRLCELFARHLATIAPALARHETDTAADPTARWRERLTGSESLIGRSSALARVLKAASSTAPLDIGILITGPSGSGKSALAELIATNGPRAKRPFIAVSCANLPNELVESELFGALPGAHSTATRKVTGKVEVADGGTLFLDEIADLALPAQAKLLQFLQDGSYFPLGSARAERADVRIIAATNADLAERIRDGAFREDLYYRLCVIEITMPPLDERRPDIRLLAERFLSEAVSRLALPDLKLSRQSIHALECAEWPGHVRQLRHCIEAAAVRTLADEIEVIEPMHLFPNKARPQARSSYHDLMRAHQRQVLKEALTRHAWNVTETAETLGLGRSSLYQMIKTLGLERS